MAKTQSSHGPSLDKGQKQGEENVPVKVAKHVEAAGEGGKVEEQRGRRKERRRGREMTS